MTATWHVDPDRLGRYLALDVNDAAAASIEAHLIACSSCRDALRAIDHEQTIDASWGRLERRIDAEIADPLVRAGHALGLPELDLRLIAPTRSLRWSSTVASVFALVAAALLSARPGDASMTRVVFLIVAPLLPLVAVVSAISTGREPAPEIARIAPFSRLRIGALRAAVALLSALVAGLATAAIVPGPWTSLSLWLLPALVLSSLGLIGARLATERVVIATLGTSWIVGVTVAARLTDDSLAAFRSGPQLLYLVVTLTALFLVAMRPSILDLREST